jgi:hypothetical protein
MSQVPILVASDDFAHSNVEQHQNLDDNAIVGEEAPWYRNINCFNSILFLKKTTTGCCGVSCWQAVVFFITLFAPVGLLVADVIINAVDANPSNAPAYKAKWIEAVFRASLVVQIMANVDFGLSLHTYGQDMKVWATCFHKLNKADMEKGRGKGTFDPQPVNDMVGDDSCPHFLIDWSGLGWSCTCQQAKHICVPVACAGWLSVFFMLLWRVGGDITKARQEPWVILCICTEGVIFRCVYTYKKRRGFLKPLAAHDLAATLKTAGPDPLCLI